MNKWESAIRELHNGKGVRWVYPDSYEAHISTHGKFLSCGTYPTEKQAQEAVILTKIKLFEASVLAHGDNPAEVIESIERGYFVSPKGNVYNKHGEVMQGAVDRCGYRHVILNRKNKNVHRLIAEAFIPNPKHLRCVNHKDGNKLNNSVENLEWCTHSQNTRHSYRNGLQSEVGNKHGVYRVLEEVDFEIIRDLHHRGYIDKEIAAEIGCSRGLVSRKIREWGIRSDHD